ncbi:hypothetical protein [Streptomyces spectabilis]|uniref:Lipoprotein n=1 Tax=Streptomyces spectabilis TaxID=68270 RepID=A0A516R8J7_STRST|nr:hypothetical protein [Streptomyces spectabilis]QDQ11983.1 hypothetical protein FH965_16560 [Streptomyces spectabilis]
MHAFSRRTTFAALCLATAATVTLTGCGGDKSDDTKKPAAAAKKKDPFADLSGPQIIDKAMKATSGASSLRMKGSMADGGGPGFIDLALDTKGQCVGTIGTGGEGSVDLIGKGKTMYMRYDAAFLRSEMKGEKDIDVQGSVDMMADRWVKTSATKSDEKDFAEFCDLKTVLSDFEDTESAARKGKATTVDGTPAIALHESDGKERATLYVATEGKPYLLKAVNDPGKGKKKDTLTFTDFDKPVKATPPKGDVLDLDTLDG